MKSYEEYAAEAEEMLKKESWTGRELGRALIFDLDCSRYYPGKVAPIAGDMILQLAAKLSKEEYAIYRTYNSIYAGVQVAYNFAQFHLEQFHSSFYKLYFSLRECANAEQIRQVDELQPLCITVSEKASIEEAVLSQRGSQQTSWHNVFFYVLESCLNSAGWTPEPVWDELEKLKSEPCTNERILAAYNRETGKGVYTLPDGSQREDLKTIDPFSMQGADIVENLLRTEEGRCSSSDEARENFLWRLECLYRGSNFIKETYKTLTGEDFNTYGFSDKDILNTATEIVHGKYDIDKASLWTMLETVLRLPAGTKWTVSEETPSISKYTALKDMLRFYSGRRKTEPSRPGEYEQGAAERSYLKEFKEDYKGLFDALAEYINSIVPEIPRGNNLFKVMYAYEDLAEIPCYQSYFNLTEYDLADYFSKDGAESDPVKYKRILNAGIAILSRYSRKAPMQAHESINNIKDFTENNSSLGSELQQEIDHHIKPSMQFIYTFNRLIDVLDSIYGEGIAELKVENDLEEFMREYNNTLYVSLFSLNGDGDEDQISEKRKLFKTVFKPIDTDGLYPDNIYFDNIYHSMSQLAFEEPAWETLVHFIDFVALISKKGKVSE